MIRIKPQHLQKVIEMLADSTNKHFKVRGTIDNNIIHYHRLLFNSFQRIQ